jgi:mono/diheme cytochrome c family protein
LAIPSVFHHENTMNRPHWIVSAFLTALMAATARAGETALLGAQAKAILQTHCAACHAGGSAVKGGFGFVLDRDLLVNRALVAPGQTSESELFLRVQQGTMPPKSSKTRPSAAEVRVLQRWIEAGAPAFDAANVSAKPMTPTEATDAILADLQRLDPRRHRFIRYLTLSHFAYAERPAKDLDTLREAAGKLLNSLSWHPRITKPEPIDAGATILRIDLRAYKWNAGMWDRLATAYPYRLQTTAESKALAGITGTEVAALRADWFVANASRPPFYHDLLQLPTGDRALERLLQVDVLADIQDDAIQRAGFNDSGVSKNNRMLERHDAAYGTYWRSYDFSNNNARQNLFEHPLGPNTGATSFQPAGGEMIFHLPNGLQAYMLVDGKGKRIDKGPTEIVADPRRPDQRVETGISCMSCHARGLLVKADQVRGHVEKNAAVFGKDIVDTVRATHPTKAKFQAQIEEDNVRYVRALERFGLCDPDQEPVNLITQRFEGTLDGATAAAELGLKPAEFAAFLKQNPDQARLFGSLLVKGGTAQRAVFQEQFPELARRVLAAQTLVAAKARPKLEPAFVGHTGTVNAIAFSKDGARAASASDDRTIRVWEVPSGRLLATLEGGSEVYAVAFSSNGKSLLSAGRDRLLRLWNLDTSKQARVFRGHTDSVRTVAFSPDNKRVVSGGDDRAIRIWDLASGEELSTLDGHTAAVTSVVWGKAGKILSGSRDATARWWDVANKKQLARLEGHAGPVLSVALSSDGKSALSAGNDQTIRYWNLGTATETFCFKGHQNAVVQVQFHRNGREFASASSQHRTHELAWRRWSVNDRKETAARKADAADSFSCAAFSVDGAHLLVGGPGGFMRLLSW